MPVSSARGTDEKLQKNTEKGGCVDATSAWLSFMFAEGTSHGAARDGEKLAKRISHRGRKVLDKEGILRYTASCKEKTFTGGMLCMVLSRSQMR